MRKYRKYAQFALSLILAILFAALCRAEEFGRLPFSEYYAYDHGVPLNSEINIIEETEKYTLYSLSFDGAWGRRVPALYMVPKSGRPPYPAIVFGHGFLGNKDAVRPALGFMAEKHIAAVSIDMWYHGDRTVEGKQMYSRYLYQMREGLALSVVDLRRAVDFLESRTGEIDSGRIGYAGASMGGILGALFAAVDTRVQAPVFIVGGSNWEYLFTHSLVAQVGVGFTYAESKSLGRLATRILAPVDPLNLVQLIAPRPMLMLNAKHDVLVNPVSSKMMFVRAMPPKKIVWFDSGHDLPFNDACALMLDWVKLYMVEHKAPDFTSIVEGWKTVPVQIDENMKLRPPVSEMSYNEYLEYDHDLPLLSYRDPIDTENQNMSKFKIRYQSTHDRMVEGVLNVPTVGQSPYPLVIFVHDLGGSESDLDIVADILARNGIASVATGCYGFQNGRKNEFNGGKSSIYIMRDMITQSVQDTRRLIDFMQKIDEIVMPNLTILGVGVGGNVATAVAGVDDRVKAVVVMNSGAELHKYWKKLADRELISQGEEEKKDEERSEIALRPVEAGEYMGHIAPRPVLILNEKENGMYDTESANKLYERAGEPKQKICIEPDADGKGVSIGEMMEALVLFLWNVYKSNTANAGSENQNRGIFGMDTTGNMRRQMDMERIEKEKGNASGIEALNWMETKNGGGNEIILNARPAKKSEIGATVVAAVYEHGAPVRYIQLLDSGTGVDNKKGDGIYSGIVKPMKKEGQLTVKVGGVGSSGELLIEKTVRIRS